MIVVDSSVAIKWVIREPGHEAALSLFDRRDVLAAPDLLIPEVATILRKKLRAGEVTPQQAEQGLDAIVAAIGMILPLARSPDRRLTSPADLTTRPMIASSSPQPSRRAFSSRPTGPSS